MNPFLILGIGSGISYMFNNQHKFNILTLYSTNRRVFCTLKLPYKLHLFSIFCSYHHLTLCVCVCRAERERAKAQQQSISNKLFTFEGTDDSGYPIYSPASQVQQVCQVVDGFIYVANAEPGKGNRRAHFWFFFFFVCSSATTVSNPACWENRTDHEEPCLWQVRGCLRGLRFGLCWALPAVQPPDLYWCSLVSPEKNQKQPTHKVQPAETEAGIGPPVFTWHRDSACPSWLTPGW